MTLYERIESLRKSKKILKEILKKSLAFPMVLYQNGKTVHLHQKSCTPLEYRISIFYSAADGPVTV